MLGDYRELPSCLTELYWLTPFFQLHKASIDLGWLFYVQCAVPVSGLNTLLISSCHRGVVLSPAVIPIALTVTWSKLTRAGVFCGCIGGAILGMLAWMIGCWKIFGECCLSFSLLFHHHHTTSRKG